MYEVDPKYYFRLHHVRPRFKDNIENVLVYVASSIERIGTSDKEGFRDALNAEIRLFQGNSNKDKKTINNWRTEISSLFGFFYEKNGDIIAGRQAIELAQSGDLVALFKRFLFTFQYPGAHIKAHEIIEQIRKGVKFKPAQTIIRLLSHQSRNAGRRYITRLEACHCVFNDLRCTSMKFKENTEETWKRIESNREKNVIYDTKGDVIRYAGDILDYMVLADLLETHDNSKFYLSKSSPVAIRIFRDSDVWFNGYDQLYDVDSLDLDSINEQKSKWFEYVNNTKYPQDLGTDIASYLQSDEEENEKKFDGDYIDIARRAIFDNIDKTTTKQIGDVGVSLICLHEKNRLIQDGREDLVHLIKSIPDSYAMGYDIQSRNSDATFRNIEVKTTISAKALSFNRVSITRNEWASAVSNGDRYYIYRLMITKHSVRLYVVKDPIEQFRKGCIGVEPSGNVDLTFGANAGNDERLLLDQNEKI